jgi:hypothetical protein
MSGENDGHKRRLKSGYRDILTNVPQRASGTLYSVLVVYCGPPFH